MVQTSSRLLVVGAGPTGLTAAIELVRRGLSVDIIDSKERPTPLSKAVGVSPHSLELLEPSGVTERLLAEGIRIQHAGAWFNGHRVGLIDFSVIRHRFNFLLSLPQSETESILAARLQDLGVSVRWKNRLRRLFQREDGMEVVLESDRGTSTARYTHVYGADGADSTVRACLDLEFKGRTHKRIWSIADVVFDKWPHDPHAAQAFLHSSGDVAFIIPIGDQKFRIVSNTPDAIARVDGSFRVARVLRTDTFHIPARQTATFHMGDVYLGGDAAHAHSPLGARGMNLGIEDAVSFASRFCRKDLEGYTAEREPVARRWIALSERALGLVQSRNIGVILLRNLLLRIVRLVPALQRPLLERVAGLRE